MSLQELLLGDENRDKVVADCLELIDAEVKDKGGLSGLGIKAGYKVVKGIKPGFVEKAIRHLLPAFCEKLEPTYEAAKSGDIRSHFVENSSTIADALLEITDERAKRSKNPAAAKAYQKLRGTAKKNVEAAMPRLGALVGKYHHV